MSSEPIKPDDRELEDFLHGSSRIGAAYREAARQDGAPPELDAAIFAMARAAVASPQRRRPRWVQPMALAATLALSLGVLLNIWRDPSSRRQLTPEENLVIDGRAGPSVESPAAGAAAGASVEAQAAPTREAYADSARLKPAAKAEPLKKEKAAEAPAPPPPPAAASVAPIQRAAPAAASVPAPAPPPAAPEAKSADALGAASVQREAPLQDQPLAPAEQRSRSAGAMAPLKAQKSQRMESFAVERDRAAAAAAAAPMARDDETQDATIEEISPAQWIEGIRARVAEGHTDGARALMKDFREAHPDYPLPDDLKPYDVSPHH